MAYATQEHPTRTLMSEQYRIDTSRNVAYIEVSIDFYRELFNEWDFSPTMNRDLDDDLFEYLDECVAEIPGNPALHIDFHMSLSIADESRENACTRGIRNYFQYQLRRERNSMRRIWGDGLRYALYGAVFLFVGSQLNRHSPEDSQFEFLIEGFSIGGWVLFWELFSIIFFKVRTHREKILRLERLRDAKIAYVYAESSDSESPAGQS